MRRLPADHLEAYDSELATLPASRAVEIAQTLLAEIRRARRVPTRGESVARLMSRVSKDPESGCWIWTGHKNRAGYGGFECRIVGETLAHRSAYALLVGPLAKGVNLLHSCDRPACVNPDHLRPGSQAENIAEMVARGRQCNGERNPMAKMTGDDARALVTEYASGSPVKTLIRRYRLSRANVYRVISGDRWGHATLSERETLTRPDATPPKTKRSSSAS